MTRRFTTQWRRRKNWGLRRSGIPRIGVWRESEDVLYASTAQRADVVVMLHPDYQYSPKLVVAMASMVAVGQYDVVLGSRILCGSAVRGGMPLYKYISNRFLTVFQNLIIGARLFGISHRVSGFSREVLEKLPLEENSDDFVFDNEMIAQRHDSGFPYRRDFMPVRYEPISSSISFSRSWRYGIGVIGTTLKFRLSKWGLIHSGIFSSEGRKLESGKE